jgi:hypothetical protein
MSRSGYTEDDDESFPNALEFYRTRVGNALSGKRGQAFLRELVEALDALPEKVLGDGQLMSSDGYACALGAVALKRGVATDGLDPDDHKTLSDVFGVARCMIAEIEYENDEGPAYWVTETPEGRWRRMRWWAQENLREVPDGR